MVTDFYANVVFNTVTPSSAGAIGATTLAHPASGSIVNSLFPTDATVEVYNDVEWIMAMG